MRTEEARVGSHGGLSGGYRLLELESPGIAALARPGQFVHLRVPRLDAAVLRRPFSVYGAENGRLAFLYKIVGKGTEALSRLVPGEEVSLVGPLGNGFSRVPGDTFPVLVAGGYGVAPLRFLATRTVCRGVVFVGGAGAGDLLCVDEFRALDWEVRTATVDGSAGRRGLVTDALDEWLTGRPAGCTLEFYACGPDGMLKAVGDRAMAGGWRAWLSLDRHMGCGVGACLACVHKVWRNGEQTWARVCTDGPVFESRDVVWE